MLLLSVSACSNHQDTDGKENAESTEVKKDEVKHKEEDISVEGNESSEAKDDNSSEIENPPGNNQKNGSKTATVNADNMKKVGKEGYGYVKVPKEWVNFKDLNPNTSFQVSSPDTGQIISLNVFQDLGADAKLEDYANIVAANIQKNGGKDIKGAMVKLGNYQAAQIYANYKSGTYFLVAWIFQAEDNKYHYVCAEGTKDRITEVVGFIEKGGWTLK